MLASRAVGPSAQRAIATAVCLHALVMATAVCALGAAPAHAHAQSGQDSDEVRATAKALFERGVANYASGQYASALGDFQEAFRVRPHPLVNVNIANCYDKLGKPLEAVSHFQRFLDSDAGTPAQRTEVTAAVERLKQQIGKVVLHITPEGALAVIDQDKEHRAPLTDAVPLEAGKHTLEVRLPGYTTLHQTLNVPGGSTLELSLALEPETSAEVRPAAPAQPALVIKPTTEQPTTPVEPGLVEPEARPVPREMPAPLAEAPQAPRPKPSLPTHVWIVGGVGLTLAAVGSITGLLALDADSDFDAARSARFDTAATGLQRLAAYNDARDAASRADALALTTDLLLGGALISAGVTIYLIATAQARERKSGSAQLSPLLSTRVAGLQLRTQL